jgi:hypothetical protein
MWQKIETAPNDKPVLVCNRIGPIPVIAWKIESEWSQFGIYGGALLRPQPTHWMPLPAPPDGTQGRK